MTTQPPSNQAPTPAKDAGASSHPLLRVILQLHLPAIALGFGMGATVPVVPEFAKSFGVGAGQASLVFVATMLGGLIASIPIGYMLDKIGRRRILILGPAITALAAFLTASAGSFEALLIYRFIGGWGTQMWTLSRLAMIADTNSSGSRGRMITSLLGVQHVGTLAGPLAGGLVAVTYGLEVAFVIQGVFALVAMTPGFFTRETMPQGGPRRAAASGASAPAETFSWKALLGHPIPVMFLAQWLGMTARGGIVAGSTVFVYASYAYDADPRTLGVLSSLDGGGGNTAHVRRRVPDGPLRAEDIHRARPLCAGRRDGLPGRHVVHRAGVRLVRGRICRPADHEQPAHRLVASHQFRPRTPRRQGAVLRGGTHGHASRVRDQSRDLRDLHGPLRLHPGAGSRRRRRNALLDHPWHVRARDPPQVLFSQRGRIGSAFPCHSYGAQT